MTSTRAVAYIGGASLLLAWLAAASGDPQRPRPVRDASPREDAQVLQRIASDVQAQAARLRERLATAPAPEQSLRNPFAFGLREPSASRRRAPVAAAVVPDEPRVPVEPALVLVGVAEQETPDGIVRTAMLTIGGDDLLMVTAGQPVGLRYRVVAVGADAVELKDTVTGQTLRLALQ